MRKHRLGKLLLIVLCVSLLVFLAGCRPSPVLEQIIYEQNHQVDPDTETKTMNDDLENEERDEDIPSRKTVDDSEQEKDQEYTSALAGDEDTDPDAQLDAVYDVVYSPTGELSEPDKTTPTEGSTSEEATGTTKDGGDEGEGAPSDEAGEESGTDGASGEDATQGGTGDGEAQGDNGTGAGEQQTTGGGNGDLEDNDGEKSGTGQKPTKDRVMTQINLDNGDVLNIPTDVDTVAAPGEAATIVEMLDSDGRLVATSSSFTENSFAQDAFDLSGVSVCWSGDGSSYCDNFDAFLDADPDVCFTISGQDTLSDAQIAALNERNIGYVTLPKLNSIENIKEAVNLVGLVLDQSTEGRTGAQAVASNYCSWADNTINWARENYSTKATTYIGRWEDAAHWEINSYQGKGVLMSGDGAPVSMKYNNVSPLDECMSYAGLINTALDNYYVEPLNQLTWYPSITGGTGFYPTSYRVHIIYSDDVGAGLGTEKFPAVIVEKESVRENILNAEGGNYFNYHWLAGSIMNFGKTTGYGFSDGQGSFLSTDIQRDIPYKILVNPSGVGSWAKGSVESPLEAAWLACEFQGRDMGELQRMVSEFYSMYYDTDANISAIMPAEWTYPG